MGVTIPVVITVYEDRSFTFITKTPPAAVLIRQAIGIEKGSGEPNRTKVGTITNDQVRAIAEKKLRRPERARRRSGGQDHRGHRPLDGRGGRGVMAKHGKTYVEARAKVDRDARVHARTRPSSSMKETKRAKFDESVEVHIRTGLNVRHADEQLRGTIALPHGLGKDVKIAVFAKGDKAREAEEAGADFVGAEDLAERIQDGLHRLRRRDRDAGHDAGRRPPGPHPRPAGQDAEPEGRHRDDGRRARPSRSPRPARSSTAPTAPRSST